MPIIVPSCASYQPSEARTLMSSSGAPMSMLLIYWRKCSSSTLIRESRLNKPWPIPTWKDFTLKKTSQVAPQSVTMISTSNFLVWRSLSIKSSYMKRFSSTTARRPCKSTRGSRRRIPGESFTWSTQRRDSELCINKTQLFCRSSKREEYRLLIKGQPRLLIPQVLLPLNNQTNETRQRHMCLLVCSFSNKVFSSKKSNCPFYSLTTPHNQLN